MFSSAAAIELTELALVAASHSRYASYVGLAFVAKPNIIYHKLLYLYAELCCS